MSVTIEEIVSPALEMIKVKDPLAVIDASEAKTAIRELNDMMIALADHDGISLGYTIASSITDEVTTPDWSHGMMRARLALLLADEFGKPLTAGLVAKATEYTAGVRRRTIRLSRPSLPSGLPTGQGNSSYGYGYSDGFGTRSNFFYDELADDLTDGLGDSIDDENGNALESNNNQNP